MVDQSIFVLMGINVLMGWSFYVILLSGQFSFGNAGFMALGASGWGTAFVRATLCNWMVTLGTILSLSSRSTGGKILAMWLPITTFFALGYEHSIVNMYVIPTGMLLRAPVSIAAWWVWNQIPVTLGNVVSGTLFTARPLVFSYYKKPGLVEMEASTSSKPEIAAAS